MEDTAQTRNVVANVSDGKALEKETCDDDSAMGTRSVYETMGEGGKSLIDCNPELVKRLWD